MHCTVKAMHAPIPKTLATTLVTQPQDAPPQDLADRSSRPRQKMAQERKRKRKSHSVHIDREQDNRVDQSARQVRLHRPGLRTDFVVKEITQDACLAAASRRPSPSSRSNNTDSASSVKKAEAPEEVVPESPNR
jgi:hypothetical protein